MHWPRQLVPAIFFQARCFAKNQGAHTGHHYTALQSSSAMLKRLQEARRSFMQWGWKAKRAQVEVRAANGAVRQKLTLRAALQNRVQSL